MSSHVLCFGEALVDVHPDRSVVAGAPLHVAIHLAQRGWSSSLVTRVGDDENGARVRRVLERCGVATDLVETDGDLPTGWVTVSYGPDGHAFTIHRPVAWDAIAGPEDLPPHEVLCYGSLTGRDPRSRRALRHLLGASTAPLRAFDVNLRLPDVDAEVLALGLRVATLVKVSDEEIGEVAALLGFAATPEGYFGAAPELRWLCLTRGASGAALYDRDGAAWEIEAPTVDVVDTVGAGDSFTAGLLDVLARGGAPEDALASARDVVATVLTQRGALPPCASDEP